jgi:hydrogenase maturation protease
VALRADRAQPRPLHLLRRALPRPHRGAELTQIYVAGIGNEYRLDDGAGVEVAGRLKSPQGSGTDRWTVDQLREPVDLIGRWDLVDLAVIVDAVRSGLPAGAVTVTPLVGRTPAGGPHRSPGTSSHTLTVLDVLDLSCALDLAPVRVVLVGIEGRHFGDGLGLSEPVQAAVGVAVGEVGALIAKAVHRQHRPS